MFRDYTANAPDTVSADLRRSTWPSRQPTIRSRSPGSRSWSSPSTTAGEADAVEADTAGLRRGPEPVSVSGGKPQITSTSRLRTIWRSVGAAGRSSRACTGMTSAPRALDELVEHVATGARPRRRVPVTAQGGAIARVEGDAMAYTGRAARFRP